MEKKQKNAVLLQIETLPVNGMENVEEYHIHYYYDHPSFVVKVWIKNTSGPGSFFYGDDLYNEYAEKIEDLKCDPYIHLHLRFSGDCIHNYTHPLDHFCDQKQALGLFKLYEHIFNKLPWEESIYDSDLRKYIKEMYNLDDTILNNIILD